MDTRNLQEETAGSETTDGNELFSFETSIGLEGNPCAERLLFSENKLAVSNGHIDRNREWPFDEIEEFRVEPSVGSCFFQAKVKGRWVDVLRRPGNLDQQLLTLADRLNAKRNSFQDVTNDIFKQLVDKEAVFDGSISDKIKQEPQPLRTTTQILSLLRPFYGSVILLFVLSIGVVAIELIPPMLQGVLVDHVLKLDMPNTSKGQLLYYLLAIVTGLLFIRLTSMIVTIWKGIVASRVGTSMTSNLRNELVEKLNQVPLAFHDRNQVGMLMSQVAYDTETLHTFIFHMTSGFLLQSLQLVGIGVMLFYYNPVLAIYTLLPMPLIIAGTWYFTISLQPRYHHYWEAVGKQAAALKGMLSGIRVVKSFAQEEREINRFRKASRRLRDSRIAVDTSTSTFGPMMGLIFALGSLAVWYIGGRQVLFGSMTLGSLMAFLAYVAMFYAPLSSISESTAWFANFFSINRRICDLLNVANEEDQDATVSLDEAQGRVEFHNVSFSYDKARPVLSDVSFTIEPGEIVGVVGRSGSGKSTLISLIGRLYETNSGRILIDGHDLRQLHLKQLRRQIGMAPQEPFLFRGTVLENIIYGNSSATPEETILAAKQANAHDFIMRMPFGYETQLGEGGSGLSGGERQRLSIARALLFNPAILILDEATASVDAEAERAIFDAIRKESKCRTTILISHRLTTLQDVDRLLVFDNGKLIEQGTPRQLLAQGGLYASLAKLQWNSKSGQSFVNAIAGVDETPVGNTAVGDRHESIDDIYKHIAGSNGSISSRARGNSYHEETPVTEINFLDPADIATENKQQGTLNIIYKGQHIDNVRAVYAFPALYDDKYVCLRYCNSSGQEREIGIIDKLDHWPRQIQESLRRSLGRQHFLRPILGIQQMRTKGNLLTMLVITKGGSENIYIDKPGEGCFPYGAKGLLLLDTKGNYFIIPDRSTLPKYQQRLFDLYFGD